MGQRFSLLRSFRWAFAGFVRSVRNERNLRIHLCAAIYVAVFGAISGLSAGHWAAVLLCCALVIALELMNTALEALCNRVTRESDPAIRAAKDAAAGAVLTAACFSTAVAAVIWIHGGYLPALCAWLSRHPAGDALLALSAAAAALFVFFPRWGRSKPRRED